MRFQDQGVGGARVNPTSGDGGDHVGRPIKVEESALGITVGAQYPAVEGEFDGAVVRARERLNKTRNLLEKMRDCGAQQAG